MPERLGLTAMFAGQFDWETLMHSTKIKEVRTGSPSCRDSGGGIRAVKLTLCAALLATVAGAQTSADWTITTIAGTGRSGCGVNRNRGDGGPATQELLCSPTGVAVDGGGNLFIADESERTIRMVDSSGIITTIAGYGVGGDGGPAVDARLYKPYGVAVDGAGNLFIADTSNHRIRKVDSSGTITTIVGPGSTVRNHRGGFHGDGGPATAALLKYPQGVAVDRAGNLYIADRSNHRIRKVDSSGIITTIAGSGSTGVGEPGFSGDGGLAVDARLFSPSGVAVDGAGNLYIADTGNNRVP